MGRREKRALGAFLQTFSSEYTRGQTERKEEQRTARAEWFKCIMEGGKNEDCLSMSGYRPEEDELHGALSERERRIEVEEAPKRREEATLGQFLEAKRTGEMPEIGEMTPEAFKLYQKHKLEPKAEFGVKPHYMEGLSDEEKERAIRISAGLKPRARQPKEPEVPYQVKEAVAGKEEREKEIKAYARDFRKAWYKRTQEVKAEKAEPITKEAFWRDWKETLPDPGDLHAYLLAKKVAKRVGIKPSSAMELQTTRKGERKFFGATSYEEVETAVADMPEPKKSEILRQAREFFGVK